MSSSIVRTAVTAGAASIVWKTGADWKLVTAGTSLIACTAGTPMIAWRAGTPLIA
jgi:hypothetical protein